MPAVIFISLFILIFTATVAFFLGTNKQRTKAIKVLAKELDFQFYPEGSDRLPPLLTQLDFLEEEDFYAEANGNYLVLYPTGQGIPQQHTVSMQNGQDYAESRFLQPEEIPLFLETSTTFLKLLRGN